MAFVETERDGGIFIIRTFMDEMVLQRAAEGGMEVVMVKRAADPDHTVADSQFPRL